MIDLRFRPDVNPTRWFIEYNNLGIKTENLGHENLLLISPAQPADRHCAVGNFDLKLVDRFLKGVPLPSLIDDPRTEAF
jgi:hypothetical protein